MKTKENATGSRYVGSRGTGTTNAALLDVEGVASLLNCSTRHLYRLADAGRMPRPVKLGSLVRWNRDTLETWLAEGCPSCRTGKGLLRRSAGQGVDA